MKHFRVPSGHVEYCLDNANALVATGEDVAVETSPTLPFPGVIQDLVDAQLPFVIQLEDDQLTFFDDALSEPTPLRYPKKLEHRLTAYSVLQLVLAKSIGTPYGHADQRDGVIVQDLFPRKDLLDRPNSSFGATRPFVFHADQSYNPDRNQSPNWVTLACVRNIEGGVTSVARLCDIALELTPAEEHALAQPEFRFHIGAPEVSKASSVGPILVKNTAGSEDIRLGTDVEPLTANAATAFQGLIRAAQAVAEGVVLDRGQVLFLPNQKCVHGRDGFRAHSDPALRRLLQRVYIRTSSNSASA